MSYDKDIIKNLNLPFQVVVGGSEATLITTIDKAFKDKTPLLFYFYEPQWAQSKYKLDVVKLPDITKQCEVSAADQGKDGKYACDYPTDKLMKAISADLKSKNPNGVRLPPEDELDVGGPEHGHHVQERRQHDDGGGGQEVGRRQPDGVEGLAPVAAAGVTARGPVRGILRAGPQSRTETRRA